jgi:hypothetical protein
MISTPLNTWSASSGSNRPSYLMMYRLGLHRRPFPCRLTYLFEAFGIDCQGHLSCGWRYQSDCRRSYCLDQKQVAELKPVMNSFDGQVFYNIYYQYYYCVFQIQYLTCFDWQQIRINYSILHFTCGCCVMRGLLVQAIHYFKHSYRR